MEERQDIEVLNQEVRITVTTKCQGIGHTLTIVFPKGMPIAGIVELAVKEVVRQTHVEFRRTGKVRDLTINADNLSKIKVLSMLEKLSKDDIALLRSLLEKQS